MRSLVVESMSLLFKYIQFSSLNVYSMNLCVGKGQVLIYRISHAYVCTLVVCIQQKCKSFCVCRIHALGLHHIN